MFGKRSKKKDIVYAGGGGFWGRKAPIEQPKPLPRDIKGRFVPSGENDDQKA